MDIEMIRSAQNPLVKRVRSVKSRKGRARERACWVEGLAPVLEAIESGWDVQTVVYSPELLRSEAAPELLARADVDARPVTAEIFERLSERDGPAGLGAIVSTRDVSLGGVVINARSMIAVLVEPQDPGNLGTIIRTAYCAGASAIVLVGNATDPFDPRALRASMGSVFRIPVATERRLEGFVSWALEGELPLIGTSARGSVNYRELDYALPAGIVMGNEQKGLPQELVDVCSALVSIPMRGTIRSLNLSVAASIVLYEAASRSGTNIEATSGS